MRRQTHCGTKGSWLNPPHSMFFNASCQKHDFGYSKGGDKFKRMECDVKFFAMMLLDSMGVKNRIKRVYFQIWAVLYFLAVRFFGKKHFNYRNE